jgi:hypothetical protein
MPAWRFPNATNARSTELSVRMTTGAVTLVRRASSLAHCTLASTPWGCAGGGGGALQKQWSMVEGRWRSGAGGRGPGRGWVQGWVQGVGAGGGCRGEELEVVRWRYDQSARIGRYAVQYADARARQKKSKSINKQNSTKLASASALASAPGEGAATP